MAAGRFLEEVLARVPGTYDIIVFGAEPRVNYNRIMLSPVLAGEKQFEEIVIHDDAWYAQNGVNLRKGVEIISIDRAGKRVIAQGGTSETYDTLVVATGSTPTILPVFGVDLKGVVTYRDLDDVHFMLDAATRSRRAVVIGGGLLGLEAAAGLRAQGMDVAVLHLMPALMERQLDPAAGALLKNALQARGVQVRTSADTAAILGDESVTGVRLKDGTEIAADLVVMAVGIRPHASLAKNAELATNRGIVVDDAMRTSDGAIFAIGECVEHGGMSYGLVAPLYEMAKVAAAQIAGDDAEVFVGMSTATKLKVTGIDLFSAGDFSDRAGREEIVLEASAVGIYKRLVVQDSRLVGAVLYGDTADGPWFFDLMRGSIDIAAMRDLLIFGEAYASTPASSAGQRTGGSAVQQSIAA
jgi:nitrite reductase (NADH) large subunit